MSQNSKDVNSQISTDHVSVTLDFGTLIGMNHHNIYGLREPNQVIQRTECVTQVMTPYQIFQVTEQRTFKLTNNQLSEEVEKICRAKDLN